MRRHALAAVLPLALAIAACQGAPPAPSPASPPVASGSGATAPAAAGPGQGVIRGQVSAEGIAAGAFRTLLQAAPGKGGTVKATSAVDTKEVACGPDGKFECVVKGGGEYTLEASVPDGKGGVFKVVSDKKIAVPLANDPPIVDAPSLVTRRTGSIQGVVVLKDGKPGDTAEGADVFLSGGTAVVGKCGETGRFALTGVAEGTWNLVVMKPGYKRVLVKDVPVKAGKPRIIDQTLVLERASSDATAGIKGVVQSSTGGAIAGAMISAFPKDRARLVGNDAALDNFTAVSDDQGAFEMLSLPPGEYEVQVYRPFYQLPPRVVATVKEGAPADMGSIKLTSTVAYFGKVAGQVRDEKGRPLDGAVIQLDPPVTDAQFADATGAFTLDRVLPGEYTLTVAAGGYKPYETLLRVENQQGFEARLAAPVALAPGGLKAPAPGPVPAPPPDGVYDLPDETPAPPPNEQIGPPEFSPPDDDNRLVNGDFGRGTEGWAVTCHTWGASGGGAWPAGHCGEFWSTAGGGLKLSGSVSPYDGPYLKAVQTVRSSGDCVITGDVTVHRLATCHNGVFVIAELLDDRGAGLGQIAAYTLGGGCDWYTNTPTTLWQREDGWKPGAGAQAFTLDVQQALDLYLSGVRKADVAQVRLTLQTYSDLGEADATFGSLRVSPR